VARRADGRPIDAIVRDDIRAPLGGIDLYLRLPDTVESRLAVLEADPAPANPPALPPPDALLWRALPPSLHPLERTYSRPDVRHAVLPNGGGVMSARGLAHFYSALAGAGPGQQLLLSTERLRLVTTLQTEEVDRVIGVPVRKALGYWLGGPLSPMGNRVTAFGHPGYGGSIGFADPEHRFAFALVKNRMTANAPGEGTADRVASAVRAALGIPEHTSP
jgi:CubicO group peptidase (beta-lactamase class C family)